MRESEDWLDIYITSSRQHPTNASTLLSSHFPPLNAYSILFYLPPHFAPQAFSLLCHFPNLLPVSLRMASNSWLKVVSLSPAPHPQKLPFHFCSSLYHHIPWRSEPCPSTWCQGPWADRGGRKKYMVAQPLSPRRVTKGLGISVGCLPRLLNFNLLSSFSQPANSPMLPLLLELSGKVTKSQGLSSVLILCLSKLYHWSLPFQHTYSSAKSPLKLLTHSHRANDFTFLTKHL